ncbi:hypothetical protein V8F20_011924 [Naviculisporaceae sp. PSN 640]
MWWCTGTLGTLVAGLWCLCVVLSSWAAALRALFHSNCAVVGRASRRIGSLLNRSFHQPASTHAVMDRKVLTVFHDNTCTYILQFCALEDLVLLLAQYEFV